VRVIRLKEDKDEDEETQLPRRKEFTPSIHSEENTSEKKVRPGKGGEHGGVEEEEVVEEDGVIS